MRLSLLLIEIFEACGPNPHDKPQASNWKYGMKAPLSNRKGPLVPVAEGYAMDNYTELQQLRRELDWVRNVPGRADLQASLQCDIEILEFRIGEEYKNQREEAILKLGPPACVDSLVRAVLDRWALNNADNARWRDPEHLRILQIAFGDDALGRCWCQEDVQGPAAAFCGCHMSIDDEEVITVTLLDDGICSRIPIVCIRPSRITPAKGRQAVRRRKNVLHVEECDCPTQISDGGDDEQVLLCIEDVGKI
ncbi:hypothetical protein K491DRAFT_714844 [Lophiostoma macrostomum CBS 122681]|uniref:Uncharacterized protein n=1 Tax=Lophiostoma macrostomum CBS 122681 TaxID=1314788 RepID=A0A6A6TBD6_9PLEO|nr:hypothetical protein K491DRAFT_714844 [Lophiostoma macrostomum CBS 122681]